MTRALVLALGLAAGCGGVGDGGYCANDGDCTSGDVCAHTHECLPPDQVHSVTIHWTVGGQPPNAAACSGIDHLDVGYESSIDFNDQILFSPVMCVEGEFPNDKWPIRYDLAVVDAQSAGASTTGQAAIPPDPTADVTVDVAHP